MGADSYPDCYVFIPAPYLVVWESSKDGTNLWDPVPIWEIQKKPLAPAMDWLSSGCWGYLEGEPGGSPGHGIT